MKYVLLILLFSFLNSCSFWSKEEGLSKRNTNQYYKSSGVLEYFHLEVPNWMNFRESGRCFLSSRISYLKMFEMKKKRGMSYRQSVQFQLFYNDEYEQEKRKSSHSKTENFQLSFKQKEKLFYRVAQSIESNVYIFKAPKYKRIHLIWIDSALGDKTETKRIKRLMTTKTMDLGYPVFVSECLSRFELKMFLTGIMKPDASYRIISAEMFNNYNSDSMNIPYFGLDFSKLFSKKQKIYLYTKWPKPYGYKGVYKIKKY